MDSYWSPGRYTYLITYDIADDDRRTTVSDLLAGHGARVQYSVFEVTLPTRKVIQRLRAQLRKRIDRDEDQIRLYPLPGPVLNELVILGNRRIEERADYWIL
ncbi:hypothetical protein AS200_44440 (plasmid) [Streptomyces sp. CdTB01]|nr:hypothetical protein AS200_44440 [Streptomyces sp. CdTB01]